MVRAIGSGSLPSRYRKSGRAKRRSTATYKTNRLWGERKVSLNKNNGRENELSLPIVGDMSGQLLDLNSFGLDPRRFKSAFDSNILRLNICSSSAVERDISHFDYLVFQSIHKAGSYPS